MMILLGQLIVAEPSLNRIAAAPMTAQTRYDVAKVIGRLRADIAHFKEERQQLFKSLGVERDATDAERATGTLGPMLEIAPFNEATFRARMIELAEVQIEIPDGLFTQAMLETVPLSADDILSLGTLIAS